MPNLIARGMYFLSGTTFSWNEENDVECFNVKCVLLGRNFDFLGGYLVVTARYLMVATGYCSLSGVYCSLPSGCYRLLLVTWWLLLVTAR